MIDSSNIWVVVLAGGAGTRLQGLTTHGDGTAVPKQYCSLRGGPSLLLDTVARARELAPVERVVAVVAAEHEQWWRPQLTSRRALGLPARNVLLQPQNRGTAAGLLFAVAAIAARDETARVAVLPSDHFIERPAVLRATMRRALQSCAFEPRRLFLLGITPDAPETEYGWIVPGARAPGGYAVVHFVEKPPIDEAEALLAAGAVWHSFLLAADVRALWRLGERVCPEVTRALARVMASPPDRRAVELARAYGTLPVRDFARDLLPGNERDLTLLRVPPCGWTDLGTPRRLVDCIAALERGGAAAPATEFDTVDLARSVHDHHIALA